MASGWWVGIVGHTGHSPQSPGTKTEAEKSGIGLGARSPLWGWRLEGHGSGSSYGLGHSSKSKEIGNFKVFANSFEVLWWEQRQSRLGEISPITSTKLTQERLEGKWCFHRNLKHFFPSNFRGSFIEPFY